jgi:hypothetical protein
MNDSFGGGTSAHGWVDLNADGYHDLVASTMGTTGKVYVFLGGPDGITTAQPTPLGSADSGWGTLVTPGDFNMDGYGDLVVGASGVGSGLGQIYLYSGTATGLNATATSTLGGTDTAGAFGGPLGRRGPLRRRR